MAIAPSCSRSLRAAGWVVYLKEGKLKYGYNFASLKYSYVEAAEPVPTGTHQVRVESAYDGEGLGKGASITLYVDGVQVGEGHLDATIPIGFSADETTDVGKDTGSRVVPDYDYGSTFTGTVNWVQISTGMDDQGHLIPPEQQMLFHLAQHTDTTWVPDQGYVPRWPVEASQETTCEPVVPRHE